VMASFYKKLNTPIKESLDDDFPDPNPKLLGEGLNNIGIKFVDTLKTSVGKIKSTLKRDPNGKLSLLAEPEFKINSNISLEMKLSTENKFEDTLSFSNYILEGSKFYLKEGYADKELNVEGGFEFKNTNIALNGSLSYPDLNIKAAGVYSDQGYSIGGDAELNLLDLHKWSIKFQKDTEDSTFCAFSNHVLVPKPKESPKSDIGFGFHHKVRPGLSAALDFKLDTELSSELRFGSNYDIDERSSFKSRVSLKKKEEFRLGLAYKNKVADSTKLAFSADLNTRVLFGGEGKNDHKFWVTLTCGD